MFEQECVPFAPSLIESMRSLGYSFSSAIADLIDNSISADARIIDIISEPDSNPSLIILDDGCGMSAEKLYEAMRYGSSNPLEKRNENDLGRFGLGMKAASLSQCRKLVVISKQNDEINGYSWDLDYVIQKGSWMLKGFQKEEIDNFPHINMLKEQDSGTYILLSEFDRIEESTNDISKTFSAYLDEMQDHLSLVFHRFLEEGLKIRINNREIDYMDPFLSYHPATQKKKESNIYIDGVEITLKPFILPHYLKLKPEDIKKVGGLENLRTQQGFYVYRNKRLIIWGTWFRLERKGELSKLARVRVDIPNSLDYMWSIDVKKSTATLPDKIKKNMYSAVLDSINGSHKVYNHRGRKDKKDDDITYVWERVKKREGYEYLINRDIPQLKVLENTMDSKQIELLDAAIRTIEESFPISALYLDAAKGDIHENDNNKSNEEIESLWDTLLPSLQMAKENPSLLEICRQFTNVEPYCRYPVLVERIKKELGDYE